MDKVKIRLKERCMMMKQMNIGGVLDVGAAHRLDRGRVWRFPDWAFRPGKIRGRCLKKPKTKIKHQKHT